jgi:hypothetical protein
VITRQHLTTDQNAFVSLDVVYSLFPVLSELYFTDEKRLVNSGLDPVDYKHGSSKARRWVMRPFIIHQI